MRREQPMKTKTSLPLLTRRQMLLAAYGPGPRPCLDAAANWLGCDPRCRQSCILEAGHQLDKEAMEQKRAEIAEARKANRRHDRFVPAGKLLHKEAV